MALYPLAQVEEQPTGVGGRGMTYEEAKRILRPDTVEEACLMACEALDKQIPEPPVVLNQKGSKHFYCVVCDMRLVSEINGELCAGRKTRFCPYCGQAIDWEA